MKMMDGLAIRFLAPERALVLAPRALVEREVVHVWPFLLSGPESARELCAQVLSPAELQRAARFFHDRDRVAFVFSHGVMRYVLGAYCGVAAAELELAAGEFGKPQLAHPAEHGSHHLSFNLSHSHGRAVLAVSDGRAIGADIEQHNPSKDMLPIASNYFFGPEFEAIRDATEGRHTEAFFRYWTAKEAVLKGHGTGLGLALDAFHVRFDASLAWAHVQSLDESRLATDWFVRCLRCEPGWSAAVAARTDRWAVKVMTEEAEPSVASPRGFEPLLPP